MNVIVQSKTMVITGAVRAFVVGQVQRLYRREKRLPISQVTVFLENVAKKKNDIQSASAKVLIDLPGKNIVVQERAKNLHSAIGNATRAAAEQLNRMKERRLAHSALGKY